MNHDMKSYKSHGMSHDRRGGSKMGGKKMGYRHEEEGAEHLSREKAKMHGEHYHAKATSKVASSHHHHDLHEGVGHTSEKYGKSMHAKMYDKKR